MDHVINILIENVKWIVQNGVAETDITEYEMIQTFQGFYYKFKCSDNIDLVGYMVKIDMVLKTYYR